MTIGNFRTLAMVEEVTEGTTPAAALQYVNVEDFQIDPDTDEQRPPILTGDRRRFPSRRLKNAGNVTVKTKLQYLNTLLLMEGLFGASRSAAISVTAATIATTATTITDSANGLGVFAKGDLVKVSGFGTPTADNRWYGPVSAVAAGSLTIPTGQTSGVHAAGDSVTVQTRRLVDGSTSKFYSAEQKRTALTTSFDNAKGMHVRSGIWTWEANGWVDEEYQCLSRVPGEATATIGNGSFTASPTAPYFSGIDLVSFNWSSDIVTGNSGIFSSLRLTVENVLEPVYQLGASSMSTAKLGFMNPSLDVTVYRDDNAQDFFDVARAHTTCWLWWDIQDPAGANYAFLLSAIKPDKAVQAGSGPDSLVSGNLSFTAHDPAKDSSSPWVASAFGHQVAIFMTP